MNEQSSAAAQASAAAPSTFAIPEAFVVDPIAKQRLARQLRAAPPEVRGIAAVVTPLPPGASYRTHAERLALAPPDAVAPFEATVVRGAVMVRPGVAFEVGDDDVTVAEGPLLVDGGAHVHDPWLPVGAVGDAGPDARPPFPWRPVVALLGAGATRDDELADWARATANGLVRRHVEARIAMPYAFEALHLTRPCAPSDASLDAVAPDVVLALDAEGLDLAVRRYGDDNWTVVVECVEDPTGGVLGLDWARGRGAVRARIGRGIAADELADLVQRLRAGPHPLRRPRGAPPGRVVATARRAPAAACTFVVLTGDERAADDRFAGLADHVTAAGGRVTISSPRRGATRAAESADIVVVHALGVDAVGPIAAARRRGGRPTIVDLTPADLEPDAVTDTGTDAGPPGVALTAAAHEVLRRTRAACAPTAPARDAARRLGARAVVLPPLLVRADLVRLREVRSDARRGGVVGWWPGAGTAPYLDAAARGVVDLLEHRADLTVETPGDAPAGPAAGHARVVPVAPDDLDAQARWACLLWTPGPPHAETAADARRLVAAGVLGVPVVAAAWHAPALGDLVPRERVVTDPGDAGAWSAALAAAVAAAEASPGSARAVMRRADALCGPSTSAAVANRFCGWARALGHVPAPGSEVGA
jgi:hypothetical protein